MNLNQIALIADEDTVNFFRIGGLAHVYPISSDDDIEQKFQEIVNLNLFAIILTTDLIAQEIRDFINGIIEEQEFPIIISIPSLGSKAHHGPDTITELIRRKLGIELK